jgi:hypothetical protein
VIRLSPMAVSRLYKIAHCNQSVPPASASRASD